VSRFKVPEPRVSASNPTLSKMNSNSKDGRKTVRKRKLTELIADRSILQEEIKEVLQAKGRH
jgi:hypothetical protein